MRGRPALGRELDRPRHREGRGVDGHVRARSQHFARARRQVEPDDLVGDRGRARDEDDRRAVGDEERCPAPGVVREIELLEHAGLRVEHAEARPAVPVVPAHDPPVPEEPVRAPAEHPRRVAELRLRGVQGLALTVPDPLEVPPAAPVTGEDEVSRGAPLRLPDRLLAVLPGDLRDVAQRAVRGRAAPCRARSRPRASTGGPRRGSRAASRPERCAGRRRSRGRRRSPAARPSRRSGRPRARSRRPRSARSPGGAPARRSTDARPS